ncbi:MAG: hypothetical protein NVS2B3_14320 [Vulcanimicrobiaceae bacterium]
MTAARLRTFAFSFSALSAVSLAACSGGGGSSPSPLAARATAAAAVKLGITLAGNTARIASLRSAQHGLAAASTPVTATYNGATVATGALDANGFVELTFTQSVPAGATIVVTVGTGATALVASVPLVDAVAATAALLTYDPGPPATVTVARDEDNAGNGHYDGSQPENDIEGEDAQTGEVETVDDQNDTFLPSNLPISVSSCGATATVTLATSAPGAYALTFQEVTSDTGDTNPVSYRIDPFSGPATFALASAKSRVRIELDRNGLQVLEVKAPLGGLASNGTAPATCPTVSPTAAPTM